MSNKKILHISTHEEDCGVAKYQENYLDNYDNSVFQHEFYPTSPNVIRHLRGDGLAQELEKFRSEVEKYDIVHIQLEYGLYDGHDFQQFIEISAQLHKKIVVTIHISPAYAITKPIRGGLGPRSFVNYIRQTKHYSLKKRHFIKPVKDHADILIVHNNPTKDSLISFGIDESKIKVVTHPVLIPEQIEHSDYIAKNLHKKEKDIIYGVVGFFHKHKGIFDAVRALTYLPENYKLAIIGGTNPQSEEQSIYNRITDVVRNLGLKDRVFITGYVEDDKDLYKYIKEIDVCVLPYNSKYYSHVSSGPVNIAMGLAMPTITYETAVFNEMNRLIEGVSPLKITKNPSYYELARDLQTIDKKEMSKAASKYAEYFSWKRQAQIIDSIYKSLIG